MPDTQNIRSHHTTLTEATSYWFIFHDEHLLLLNPSLSVPTDPTEFFSSLTHQHRMIEIQGISCFCAEISQCSLVPETLQPVALRQAFDLLGPSWYRVAAKAHAILCWDKTHQFCGRCGQPTAIIPTKFERKCGACDLIFYPRISPSVIVRINRGDELLMARSPHFKKGAYGLIAGFVDTGETLEEAVHREVQEEVGIRIKHLRYFSSQPWSFPDSLIAGFTAEYASGELTIDYHELEAAGWYRFDQLPGRPSSVLSISAQLIDDFIASRT